MRDLTALDNFRVRSRFVLDRFGSYGDKGNGVFMVPVPAQHTMLKCLAASGDGWDHVSVSLPSRCPTWGEMDYIKRLFFKPDETAMQLHVPTAEHINIHPYVLHLWRPHDVRIPLPPQEFV